MAIYKGLILSAVIGSMLASAAMAGDVIGTEKARGHIGGCGWTQLHEGHRHMNRDERAVRYESRPVVVQPAPTVAPATVAQVPTESRRFSYAPTTDAAASQPATTAPSVVVPTVAQPSYYRAATHRHLADKWALQKTDPRKYSSR
jgi:hypothetical protein